MMDRYEPLETVCIIDGQWGVYVPQEFASRGLGEAWGLYAEDIAVLLAGPDHEDYWEVWADVTRTASCVDANGKRWILNQDGDLFAEYWG